MGLRWEFLLVVAFAGSILCDATASKRGEDEDDDANAGDSMPEERYHAPDMYKPSNSLVERAVHRVEQNLEHVMQADLKKIEQRVMDKVNKVQGKQMRRLREIQETETMRDRNDLLPQGASELENDLVPSDEEAPDDSQTADAKKDADAASADIPPSSLAATEGLSDVDVDKSKDKEDDFAIGDDGLSKKQRENEQALHASWRTKDHEEDEGDEDDSSVAAEVAKEAKATDKDDDLKNQVSTSLEEVASVLDDKTQAKSSKHHHHSEASKHKKKSIEVDSDGDGMMRRE